MCADVLLCKLIKLTFTYCANPHYKWRSGLGNSHGHDLKAAIHHSAQGLSMNAAQLLPLTIHYQMSASKQVISNVGEPG